MPTLAKMIYIFNQILSKFKKMWVFFAEIETSILKFLLNLKGTQMHKSISKNNKFGVSNS